MRRLAAIALVACGGATPTPTSSTMLGSGLDEPAAWTSFATDGATGRVEGVPGAEGQALRLSLDFAGTSGYVQARRPLPLELPESFEISYEMRGDLPENQLEFKLVDESGLNVWWHRRTDFVAPKGWKRTVVKRRHIAFAWGPTEDKTLRRIAAIEFVVATGRGGGKGWIEIDRLAIRALPAQGPAPPPRAVASSAQEGAALALDGDPRTVWRGAAGEQTFTIDLGVERDLGGLVLRWGDAPAREYAVESSLDGRTWTPAGEVRGGNGGLDPIRFDELPARQLRLRLRDGAVALAEAQVVGVEDAARPTDFVELLARGARRGHYPRGLSGEQPYWTIVGVESAPTGLLSEDGAVEVKPGGVSVEPFVQVGDKIYSWADAEISQALVDGYLPLPSVTWRTPEWELVISLLAVGEPRDAQLVARYDLVNRGRAPLAARLVLAVKPWQVNPPRQFLNIVGGVSPIRELLWKDGALAVNGSPAIAPLAPPAQVSLYPLHAAGFPEAPLGGTGDAVSDPSGLASAALAYELEVAAGATATTGFTAPLVGPLRAPTGATFLDDAARRNREQWHEKLDRVKIRVPAAGRAVVDTLRTSLAYMLLSRDGVNLRPGTRSYARSWIRDGAMISEALFRLGHGQLGVDYLRWFAPYQFKDGKVPCCVEAQGAVPLPENDSHGQLIYLAAMVYRYTQDRALLEEMWPRVQGAIRHMEELRHSERTAANQTPERRPQYGLLPPSISHEGYSDRPAYSYWDDFWGLRGYKDAVTIAKILGDREAEARIAAQRDEFRADLMASIAASVALHEVDYIPGAAERGDFDATSTTIALSPVGEQHNLPPALLASTFEKYWQNFVARREGRTPNRNYTPYELRVIGTFVRLGWRDRAHQALAFFFDDRRPQAWNQWAEVVGEPMRTPVFIGDMPHAWVHSDYARSALDLFVHERDRDASLVLAAGIPAAWLGEGVEVAGVGTPYGPLGYRLRAAGGKVTLDVDAGAVPPGGLVLPWPFGKPGATRVNGRAVTWSGGDAPELVITSRPAKVVFEWRAGR